MRLNRYITESYYSNDGRSRYVEPKEAYDYIIKNCKKALNGTLIWRGNKNIKDSQYFIDPSKTMEDRISPFATNNFYNLLLSNLDSWKSFPKRDKSIICTTSFDNAYRRGFDSAYLVLPKDGAKIGVCPGQDIWDAFDKNSNIQSLDIINIMFSEMRESLPNKQKYIVSDQSFKEFIKLCNAVDKNIKFLKEEGLDDYDFLKEYFNANGSIKFIDFIDDLLNPKNNNIKLKHSGDSIGGDNEVWTDSMSVLVRYKSNLYDKLGLES